MARIVGVVAALSVLLAVASPAVADDSENSFIRGSVYAPSGGPAYGACASTGHYATDVQPDGTYELEVGGLSSYTVYFYDCHDAPDYPYVSRWFWGGGQDPSTAKRISVAPGGVAYANVTLPAAPGSPPEFGAVAGLISSDDPADYLEEFVYLVSEKGEVYSGFTDQVGHMPGREAGRYIVAAPPGEYRLFTRARDHSDTYLPVFFGSHPRGYAASFDEGQIFSIASGRVTTGVDFDLIAGDSANVGSSPGSWSVAVSVEADRPGIALSAHEGHIFDRAAVHEAGVDGELDDFHLLAFPGATASPSLVRIKVPAAILGAYSSETLPVWSGHTQLEGCEGGGDDECVVSRTFDPAGILVPVAVIEIRTSTGGVFTLGDRPQFYDSAGSVFGSDILWLADSGITRGCNPPSNDLFCPDDPVTRGQMAAFLARGLGLTDALDDPFTDDDGSVFEPSIEKLAAAGITRGCNPPTNDRFYPNDPVTRGQMAAFLVRALGYTDAGDGDLFGDDDGSVFEAAIDKLATAGVTRGCNPTTNDRFCPDEVVTRGQMAAFLHRALG